MSAPAGQKRKRAQDQAAALVGSKKPNTTPEPEADRDPSASPLQGESMDQSEQSVAPSSRRAESELHVGSLGGAPQVGPGAMLPFAPSFYVSHMLFCLAAWCYHVTHGQEGRCPSRVIQMCHNATIRQMNCCTQMSRYGSMAAMVTHACLNRFRQFGHAVLVSAAAMHE